MYPYMKTTLKLTRQKSKSIFGSNANLLKGLNLYNILTLARLEVYMPVCFFSAMVGLNITSSSLNVMSLLLIGLANTFALVATFAFNDAEDAPDDILARSTRNVIALGNVSKSTGYLIAATAGIISLALSIIAGAIVFFITLTILATTFLYSWRSFKLKAKPFWDLFTHAIVGGLILLSPAWSSQEGIVWKNHVIPTCLIFSLGTALAVLNHELYGYEDDLKANTRTTVVELGKKRSYWIAGFFFLIIISLIIYEFRSGTFPLLSILSFFVVGTILILIPMMLYPKQAISLSKRMIPWGINIGVLSALITWYIWG